MPQLLTLEGIDDDGEVALCGYSVAELMAGLSGGEVRLEGLGQMLRPITGLEKAQTAFEIPSLGKTKLLWLIPGAIIGVGVLVSSLIWRRGRV